MTVVQICNLALRALGSQKISALVDANEAARIMNDIYEPMRDEVMSAHPWNFAIKRVALVEDATAPIFDYGHAWTLPTDCLRVIRMEEDEEFKIEAGRLITDESSVKILYIAKITDPSKFSQLFATTLAIRLAAEAAYPLTNNQQLGVQKFNEYEMKLRLAKSADAQEGSLEAIEDSSWFTDRE